MTNKSVKIVFYDDEGNAESLWAEQLSVDRFKLDNTPWFQYRVSWNDIVIAKPNPSDGMVEFVAVAEKSGHRTIRVTLKPPSDQSDASMAVLNHLRELGCSYEGANSGFIALDIPPGVDLNTIRDYLISTGQEWEHADPTWEDLNSNK